MARKVIECRSCGQLKDHHAKGQCSYCYKKDHKKARKTIICGSCGKEAFHEGKGLCYGCYRAQAMPKRECPSCGQIRYTHGQGLCKTCYSWKFNKKYEHKIFECSICHKTEKISKKMIDGKRVCAKCIRIHYPIEHEKTLELQRQSKRRIRQKTKGVDMSWLIRELSKV